MPVFTVAENGFVFFGGRKLSFKLTPDGLEFCDRNPQRVERAGSAVFVVPFDCIMEFIAAHDGKPERIRE